MIDLTKILFGKPTHRQVLTAESPSPSDSVVIGLAEDSSPIIWPRPSSEASSSAVVLGSSGCGKTITVASALSMETTLSVSPPKQETALVLIDPKGDLIAAVLAALAHRAPARLSDVRYLNPFEGGFAFNLNHLVLGRTPIEVRAAQLAELVNNVSTGAGGIKHLGTGARQLDVLTHLILGALTARHEAATVVWALDALTQRHGFQVLARATSSERARQFLLSGNQLSDELRSSCSSRLRTAFAMTEALERMLCAPSCIAFDELTEPGAITMIDLGSPPGGMNALREFWANLLGRVVVDHLLSRPSPWGGHHVRLVADEAHLVAPTLSDSAEAVLTTGRSRGVSLIAITQGTVLLHRASPTLLDVLLTNAPLKIIGRLAAPDAEMLARERAPKAGTDETIAAIRARFSANVTNLEDRSFFHITPGSFRRFRSADVDMAAWDRAAAEHADEINTVKARLALPAETRRRLTLLEAIGDEPRTGRGRRRRAGRAAAPPAQTEPQDPSAPIIEPPLTSRPRSRWG